MVLGLVLGFVLVLLVLGLVRTIDVDDGVVLELALGPRAIIAHCMSMQFRYTSHRCTDTFSLDIRHTDAQTHAV